MKAGDLVRVVDEYGILFGHGILVEEKAEVSEVMNDQYSLVWIFNWARLVEMNIKEKTLSFRTDLITPIKSPEDW